MVEKLSRTTYKHIRHKEKSTLQLRHNIVNHWHIYLLFILLLVGIICGVLYTRTVSDQNLQNLEFLFNIHTGSILEKSAISIFTASFSSAFIVLFTIFVFGFCAIGVPVILSMVFIQGFGFGLSAGYIYASIGAKGILYNLSVIIPCMVLLFFVVLYASKHATNMSISIFKNVFLSSRDEKSDISLNEYFIKFIIFILLIFAKALIETILVLIFSGFLK